MKCLSVCFYEQIVEFTFLTAGFFEIYLSSLYLMLRHLRMPTLYQNTYQYNKLFSSSFVQFL